MADPTPKRGDIVRAKRLGWNEGPKGNLTDTDWLDPYDYPDDVVEGVYDELVLNDTGLIPTYTNYIVDGQVVDGTTVEVITPADQVGKETSATVSPATLPPSGGATVTQVVEPEVDLAKKAKPGGSTPMPDSGKCPPGMKPDESGKNCMEMSDDTEDMGGKPNPNSPADKRLKQNKKKSGYAADGEDTAQPQPQWRGVLCVEGTPTGDGREFAPDALSWAEMPLPLRWQKTDSHGGTPMNETVRVGNITRVWRDGANIMGEGFFDLEQPDGAEAFRRNGNNTLSGISIDADDITDADIEYIFPKSDDTETDDEEDIIFLLFAAPEKMIFHSARIRAATLCDIPAFVEAQIHLIDPGEAVTAGAALVAFGPVASHKTATADGSWDAAANEKNLPSPMPLGVAKDAYAWVDDAAEQDGEIPKSAGKFIHHEVNADGTPGAANLTACSSGIGILHGGRGGANIPDADRRGVYDHLAAHLRDGDQEPPPFTASPVALVAHAWHDEWRPPRDWFTDPNLGQVMPIIVTDQGRVYGHAAQWGECHLGYMSECVMPPHEDYHSYFLTGEVVCDDGSRVAVGQITAGIEHAPLPMRSSSAKQHYENTDAVVADVICGNDQHGIWVAGAIRPWAHASRVAALRGSGQVSPDWRRTGGALRMVALLTVNTSGYTVPKARSLVSGGQIQALISSGMVAVQHHGPSEDELNQRALRLMRQSLIERVHGKDA